MANFKCFRLLPASPRRQVNLPFITALTAIKKMACASFFLTQRNSKKCDAVPSTRSRPALPMRIAPGHPASRTPTPTAVTVYSTQSLSLHRAARFACCLSRCRFFYSPVYIKMRSSQLKNLTQASGPFWALAHLHHRVHGDLREVLLVLRENLKKEKRQKRMVSLHVEYTERGI